MVLPSLLMTYQEYAQDPDTELTAHIVRNIESVRNELEHEKAVQRAVRGTYKVPNRSPIYRDLVKRIDDLTQELRKLEHRAS